MGRERQCIARYGTATSAGTLHLDTDELRFRGEFRQRIPLASVSNVAVAGDMLLVTTAEGEAAFELGTQAACWADAIRNPPTLFDKLEVTPDSHVVVLGPTDPAFITTLRGRTPHAMLADALAPDTTHDLIFPLSKPWPTWSASRQSSHTWPRPTPSGSSPPKANAPLREHDILLAGRAAGLKDINVARFSSTHTAHKFVAPKAV